MSPAEYNGPNQHRQHVPEAWPAELRHNAPEVGDYLDTWFAAPFTARMNWLIENGLMIDDGRNCNEND